MMERYYIKGGSSVTAVRVGDYAIVVAGQPLPPAVRGCKIIPITSGVTLRDRDMRWHETLSLADAVGSLTFACGSGWAYPVATLDAQTARMLLDALVARYADDAGVERFEAHMREAREAKALCELMGVEDHDSFLPPLGVRLLGRILSA